MGLTIIQIYKSDGALSRCRAMPGRSVDGFDQVHGVCLPLALKWWRKKGAAGSEKLLPVRWRSRPDDEENQQAHGSKRNHVGVIRRKSDQGGRKENDSNGGKGYLNRPLRKQQSAKDDKHAEIVEQ